MPQPQLMIVYVVWLFSAVLLLWPYSFAFFALLVVALSSLAVASVLLLLCSILVRSQLLMLFFPAMIPRFRFRLLTVVTLVRAPIFVLCSNFVPDDIVERQFFDDDSEEVSSLWCSRSHAQMMLCFLMGPALCHLPATLSLLPASLHAPFTLLLFTPFVACVKVIGWIMYPLVQA